MRAIITRYLILFVLLLSVVPGVRAIERGIPFFKNFKAKDYDAHNINYDVECDDNGTVFVANFEGLLYFDGATWRKILTPGISRVTRLTKDNNGRIWVGGYNVFGYLVSDSKGNLQIKLLMSDIKKHGDNQEVDDIKIMGKHVYVHTTKNKVYTVSNGNRLVEMKKGIGYLFSHITDSTSYLRLPDGVRVGTTSKSGLHFLLPLGASTIISEANGLISDVINSVSYNQRNTIWGATTKGVFCAEVVTPYSHFTEDEGLKGEVKAINQLGKTVYIGTENGLYSLRDGKLTDLQQVTLTCWNLMKDGNKLIAPTSEGLFIVTEGGIRRLTHENTLSVCIDKKTNEYIAGGMDGIYRISQSGKSSRISTLGKVTSLTYDGDRLLAKTIYGSLWQVPSSPKSHVSQKCIRKDVDVNEPMVQYRDRYGRLWQTDNNGYNLRMKSDRKEDSNFRLWINSFGIRQLNTLFVCADGNVIVGGNFGIIILDATAVKLVKLQKGGRPYIRQVAAMSDSVLWGGYGVKDLKPVSDVSGIELPDNCHYFMVTFSTANMSLIQPDMYSYRLNGGQWSSWSYDPFVSFRNLPYGSLLLEVKSRDLFGRESGISTVRGYVHFPYYLQWWAEVLYAILLIGFISIFFRWRTKRLEKDKLKLEAIVSERTSELSETLDDLKRTQADLVRMERTATAGKLTQGLIDRILNPINYINNFSKLTSGLAKDLHDDIEDEKDNMSEDNYDDCADILEMMDQNLKKIEEHGINTTRTLRAMEAMLNNHVGALTTQDIIPLCRQAVEVTKDYHKAAIQQCQINVEAEVPDTPVMVDVNAEAFNRIILSLLNNSIYAVTKKYGQGAYAAEVLLRIEASEEIVITVHDNGIGIEDTIKEKVFDPFFTTKPTGEAAGVGLYLVRELVHDLNAEITLSSEQGNYCDFKITFRKL